MMREALARGRRVTTVAADVRALPFRSASFDVVVCADNALAHMMTLANLRAALASMTRVLRPGGLLILTTRTDYARAEHPTTSPVQVTETPDGKVLTFQLWDWHCDGEHYDMQHIQLLPDGDGYQVRVRRAVSWALTRAEITEQATLVGLLSLAWHEPADSGFFQPVLTCRKNIVQ
jgi:SAM-dependent methyltransferase